MPGFNRLMLFSAIFSFLACGVASAQSYPNKVIRIIVPVTPGSPVDVVARLLAPDLSRNLGQTVVVENRPGAGGTIGMKSVAQSEPDGHTLLLHSASFATAAAAYSNPGFDPRNDFHPIARLGSSCWVLVTEPSVPATTLEKFIAYAKANPGQLNFGFGLASGPHVLGEAFKAATGIQVNSIPYKGGAPAISDMLGGRIHMNFGTPATLMPLIKDGKIRPVAVTSPERSPELPDVPTMAESGFPEITATFWTAIFAPRATSIVIVRQIEAAVQDALKNEELRTAMRRVGFEPSNDQGVNMQEFFAQELDKWGRWSKIAGVEVN
jgi:tripartite-type tricarboxylate transporter receptor subunit TctC